MSDSYDLQKIIDALDNENNNVIVFSNVTVNNLQLGDNCNVTLNNCTIGNMVCEEIEELDMD